MPFHHINKITLSTFKDAVSRYTPAVPENLLDLDTLRYITVPSTIAERHKEPYLTKSEVEKLVEWKLKHGTFRPQLLALVRSNADELIQSTTKKAYAQLPDKSSALKTLTGLKGVGPATASLLLSIAKSDSIPFFSDELFRWCVWDEPGSPGGWQRKIKYNVKEYGMVVSKVDELMERLGVRATEVERVAWVLGKEGVDIDAEGGSEDAASAAAEEEEVNAKGEEEKEDVEVKATKKKGTKRKGGEMKTPTEGTRKSARTKK